MPKKIEMREYGNFDYFQNIKNTKDRNIEIEHSILKASSK